MKAIKECKWKVIVESSMCIHGCWWKANASGHGVYDLMSKRNFMSTKLAKHHWEKFAKVNKIKNWKYV